MAALTEEQKSLVVMRLASFVSASDVLKELKLTYQVEPTFQQLSAYDPGNAAGKRLSQELKALFDKTRTAYLSDVSDVPIAHQAGRLRMLDTIARQAHGKGNLKMAMEALEQAAKDLGGMFVRAPLSGAGTGPPGDPGGGDKSMDFDSMDFDPNRLTPEEVAEFDRLYQKASAPPGSVGSRESEGPARKA